MENLKIARPEKPKIFIDLNQQGATALLCATFDFLERNDISSESIVEFAKKYSAHRHGRKKLKTYQEVVVAYENMGVLMSTWFSDPKFLDDQGNPIPLSPKRGRQSLSNLIRASGAAVETSAALNLMYQSPSVQVTTDGLLHALRRVFVLPNLEVPRAAFVVERYLDTLKRNATSRNKNATLLLERSCHVSAVNLGSVPPVIRDIEHQGTAFLDSIDGEIESQRLRRAKRKGVAEVGVLVFAWARPSSSSSACRISPSTGSFRNSRPKVG